jgi:hypothetical protein
VIGAGLVVAAIAVAAALVRPEEPAEGAISQHPDERFTAEAERVRAQEACSEAA